MGSFIKIILSILETVIYTYLMIQVGSLEINNRILSLLMHFGALTIISLLLYYIIRFVLRKIDLKAKKNIYHICISNIIIGLVFPILLIIIIPSEKLEVLAMLMIISTGYYGLLVNILISLFNHFFTNAKK